MSQRTKHFDAAVKQVDEQRRRITFVASAQVVDRDGDVIVTAGIDTSRFTRNSVLLGYHDSSFPIGRVLNLTRGALDDGRTPALIATAELLPAGTERIDEVWALVQFGALAGVSIGFLPVTLDEKKVLPGQTGVTFRSIELLEISLVAIPSCPDCLVTQKCAGCSGESSDTITAVVRSALEEITMRETVKNAIRDAFRD